MMSEASLPFEGDGEDVYKIWEELMESLGAQQFRSFSADGEGSSSLEEEKIALVELISISRTTKGRAKLAELRVIDSLMNWLGQFPRNSVLYPKRSLEPELSSSIEELLDKLVLVLKLIRNMCAGDFTNQDAFLKCRGAYTLAWIAVELLYSGRSGSEDFDGSLSDDLADRDSALERLTARFQSSSISCKQNPNSAFPPVGCFQMMLQLLGNFARRGEACQAAVWRSFFPFHFLELAALRSEEICGPLCMVLYTCCQTNSERCWALCQGNGGALVALVIAASMDNSVDAMSSGPEQINWWGLLVQHLCLREPLFPVLFVNLGVPPSKRVVDPIKANTDEVVSACQLCLESSTFTSLQASLLFILCDCLRSQDSYGENNGGPPMPLKSMCFMVDILRKAALGAVEDSELSPIPIFFSASCTVRILGFVLSIWMMLFAWDSKDGDRTELTKFLLAHGFVELLLSLLEALGPTEVPSRGKTGAMALEDGLPHNKGTFPRKNPYMGYRRDVVAVIANLSHQNSLVQDFVRKKGGLLLVLQQCVVEKENPFLREWGLWAMRNLLEGNEQNQAEISQLEVRKSVNLPELQRMGLNVQIDPITRRPRLVNESASSLQS